MSGKHEIDQNPADNPELSPSANPRRSPLVDLIFLALRPKSVSSDSATAAWIRRHPALTLVCLAYGLTWIGLIPLILNPNLSLNPGQINLSVLVVAFLGVLGCLWAALTVAAAVGGTAARYALLRGYIKWRVGIQWYLVALLGPTLVWLAAIGLDFLLTGVLPAAPVFTYLPIPLLSSYIFFLVRYMFGNYEEICWRASLLPRLQSKYSALAASLIVGLIQGFWHLPYAFVKGSFVQAIGLPAMVLMSVAMSVVFAWVYINTRGSLLVVALFHAANDAWSPFQGSDVRLAYLMIGVWCLTAILITAVFGARQLARKPVLEIADTLPGLS